MTPVFFPFTNLTHYDAELLSIFFENFVYFSTESEYDMDRSSPGWLRELWRERKVVDPVFLTEEDAVNLTRSVETWNSWARINAGKNFERGYLKSILRDRPYFTSDTDIHFIKSQVQSSVRLRNGTDSEEISLNKREGIENDLLLLRLAMMTDRENEDVDYSLLSVGKREADLFSTLKGEPMSADGNDGGKPHLKESNIFNNQRLLAHSPDSDRGDKMTGQRLRAWINLFSAKRSSVNDSASVCFVTTSRAVIDFLLSHCKKSKLVLDIETFKVHKEKNSSGTAWSETFKIWLDREVYDSAISSSENGESPVHSDLLMKMSSSELIRGSGNALSVMLVGFGE